MSRPERLLEQAADLIRYVSSDARERHRRRRRRRRRTFAKILKTGAAMLFALIVIVVGMIASGVLLGPRGVEGMLALPLAVITTWAAILYASFGRKPAPPQEIVKSDLAQLPARTEAWLDQQRYGLPSAAQRQLDSITLQLEALTPQLQKLPAETPTAFELRRLIGEELPELIRGYQKVPRSLQTQPLYGGPSPDRQLAQGLATIDEEIGRMHKRLATEDLHALATQQRFLDMKYKGGDKG